MLLETDFNKYYTARAVGAVAQRPIDNSPQHAIAMEQDLTPGILIILVHLDLLRPFFVIILLRRNTMGAATSIPIP